MPMLRIAQRGAGRCLHIDMLRDREISDGPNSEVMGGYGKFTTPSAACYVDALVDPRLQVRGYLV